MQVLLPKSYKDEFAIAVAAKREDVIWKEKIAISELRERERRAEQRSEEAHKDAATDELIAFALATPQEVATFRVELDSYDAATVDALMSNEQSLKAVREKITAMLEEAHVLPDGRRVFKTKDGQQVFDENGQQLSNDIIDPDSIYDRKEKWETFAAEKKAERMLEEERQKLFEYQTKLDETRDRLDDGKITHKELEKMKGELAADMPDSVREKLGLEQPKTDAGPKADVEKPAMPANMDSLMQKTGFTPAP